MISRLFHLFKLYISFLLIICAVSFSYAQQDALQSQYMFNGLSINPAYAGSNEALNITAAARKQWIGIEGAPSTQTLSAHSPLKNEKIGLGLILINDQIGVTHQYSASAMYAYKIKFAENKTLSMGLQAGVYQMVSRLSTLPTRDLNDNVFSSDIKSSFIPSFGTGLYWNTPRYYLGFSIPHLFNNILMDKSMAINIFQRRHYIFTGGFITTLSSAVKLKPSILLKGIPGAPIQVDLNSNFIIKDVLWIGASYRSFSSVNFLTQVQLTNQLRLGYSYDWSTGVLKKLAHGAHELILNYNFSFVKGKIVTPRYF